MSPRQHRRSRVLAAAALGLTVAAGGLLTAPSQAAPTQATPATPTTAPTIAAAAVEVPDADLLDADFAGGTPTDHAQGLAVDTWGTPTFETDPEHGDIMRVTAPAANPQLADDAIAFDWAGQWDELTSGFAVECVFRIDTDMPIGNEKDLCSSKEAGGLSVYVTGGNLGTMAHIGGGYQTVLTPIEGHEWHHAMSVWDGTTLTLYVDGAPVGSTPATGALTVPPNPAAHRFAIGADAAPSGVGQYAPPASFVASRVWSQPLNAAQVHEAAASYGFAVQVPEADILSVDFSDGTPADAAQDLAVSTFGSPVVAPDPALGKPTATTDGFDDAYSYAFGEQWPAISESVSIECTFRLTTDLPVTAEKALCSSKEAGGYSIYVNDDQVGLMAHIGGSYKNARAQIQANRWYHVLATWDGAAIRLYVNGVLSAETPATGALTLPSVNGRPRFVVGGDTNNNTGAQFFAPAVFSSSRVWSQALDGAEVAAAYARELGGVPPAGVELVASSPEAGAHLTEPTVFELDVAKAENATGWAATLDGEPIEQGQEIGAGLRSGDHQVVVTATSVFGDAYRWEIPFTSATIPTGGGTDDGQGGGSVSLSAIADSPDGSDVTTTFREATASVAEDGFQGVVRRVPTSLEFEYDEGGEVPGAQEPDDGETTASPTSGDIPFQRFDVEVDGAAAGRRVVWSGTVDPARSVALRAWRTDTERWVELASARGNAEGETVLAGLLRHEAFVDDGVVHVMVTGVDPFADDLAPRDERATADKDRFEEPGDYDFSFAHFTDTQYLAEGAGGGTYDDWDGVQEPSDVMLEEERALWAAAYESSTQWIADNADERKIAYTAHSGDIIENEYNDPLATGPDGNLLWPGLDEQAVREYEFTSEAQARLDDAGVVNQVVAGNHDNQLGRATGPDSRFNEYYGPDRYYDASQAWPEGASYHAWDETTDEQGNTVTRGRDNQNNYVLFSAGGLDFVAVGLSYGVTQEEADWASSVFERFPDRNGILISHAYIAPSTAPDGRGAGFSVDGSRLYDEVVLDNPNVFLVLAGHEHGVGTNLKTDIGATVAHNVVELLADYQFYKVTAGELWPEKVAADGTIDLDGDGTSDHRASDLLQFGASWLRLLQFDVERSEVSIDTYSPFLDDFGATEYDDRKRYNGAEDNLVLPVDLSTRTTTFETDALTVVTPTDTVIGEATARSGWPATVEWSGLTEGEVYAWVSDSRTADGEPIRGLRQFGTVFVATAAGTDATPPVLTVPAGTELEVGEVFDPLAGVTATDDSDGDLLDRVEVIGSVDTAEPGSYALTYLVADDNGNQVVVPRVVRVVEPVDDRVATRVTVRNATATFGKRLRLTAQVSPAAATGSVQFLAGEEVLCEAVVTDGSASCRVLTLPAPGDHVVTAAFSGDEEHAPSQRSFVLDVRAPAKRDARVDAGASRKVVPPGARVVLRATLARTATGTVTFNRGGKQLCVAKVRNGKASCTLPPRLKKGRYRVVAVYKGDAGHRADRDVFTFRKR
ncbi:LamG-like jellyroll fold domain-containing protein [Nocardioides sp. TF02-7]|uniref:LamG-like jellyroll fold domain-containing protein n=1 Tax=Nocardioides sp. TF02-7 TaxID=2917724 RepID=UPI001F05A3EE|nr:LamG-like jellyroll fold domain-containing protein [Nocardioides sp. TF02-7]UMG91149.1 Ig-like domain repeat protein [Nocardioides sp. TF02-7]